MRVILSAGKRGHYYLTARALQQHGVLERFITSTFFPRRCLRRHLVPKRYVRIRSDPGLEDRRVVSLWPIEAAYRVVRPLAGRAWRRAMNAYNAAYDLASIPFLKGGTVFHFANTYGVHSAAAAKRRGMAVVLDQQSVHPGYAIDVLQAEYDRFGMWDSETDAPLVRRVLRELELADSLLVAHRLVLEENVARGIPAEKQRIVPFGVDTSLFRPSERTRKPKDPFRVLFAGRMSVRKGVPHMLEAVKRAADPRIELLCAGTAAPDIESLLPRYAKHFTRLGTLSHARLAELYREVDAFVLTSFVEGSALVTYEAMASGLPCVVTRSVGSLVEDGETGVLVPPGDPDALAAALISLADEPERGRALGRAARAVALDNDIQLYGDRLLGAYRDFFAGSVCAASA